MLYVKLPGKKSNDTDNRRRNRQPCECVRNLVFHGLGEAVGAGEGAGGGGGL